MSDTKPQIQEALRILNRINMVVGGGVEMHQDTSMSDERKSKNSKRNDPV